MIGAMARNPTHDLSVLPTSFDLTFDIFRTICKRRLIWRRGDFLGVAFENELGINSITAAS